MRSALFEVLSRPFFPETVLNVLTAICQVHGKRSAVSCFLNAVEPNRKKRGTNNPEAPRG